MTAFLVLYLGLGLICAFFLDSIFRSFPNPNRPNKIVGVLGMAWMLPGTAYSIFMYLVSPIEFGYHVQQTINQPTEKYPNIRRLFSVAITIGLAVFIAVRIIKSVP
jgi:hypothetical protein